MDQNDPKKLTEAQIHTALGAFLLFFAMTVIVSIFFTDTTVGKLTNLGAGAIIGAIGGVMILMGRRGARRPPAQ